MTYSIVSYGSILDFLPLNETAFDRLATLLPRVQTWIGVNNIEPLTPEGWFKEGHGMKEGHNNDNGIWMPFHFKGTFLRVPSPSVVVLVLRQLGRAVQKQPNRLHVFIFTKLVMPVWGRLMFNMND